MGGNSGLGSRFRLGERIFVHRSIFGLVKEARAKGRIEGARAILRRTISELRAINSSDTNGVGGYLSEVHEVDRESRESERIRFLRKHDPPPVEVPPTTRAAILRKYREVHQ